MKAFTLFPADLGWDKSKIMRQSVECFWGQRPWGRLEGYRKGGKINGPAVRPRHTSFKIFFATIWGCSDADFRLCEKRERRGPWNPTRKPSQKPCDRLLQNKTFGWFKSSLSKFSTLIGVTGFLSCRYLSTRSFCMVRWCRFFIVDDSRMEFVAADSGAAVFEGTWICGTW